MFVTNYTPNQTQTKNIFIHCYHKDHFETSYLVEFTPVLCNQA